MNSVQAKAIPLPEYLAKLSFLPAYERNGEAWYRSPFRPDEKTPSFKIDLARNIWYDHGRGEGGTIIDFAASFYGGLGVSAALSRISEVAGSTGRIVGAGSANAAARLRASTAGGEARAQSSTPPPRDKPVIERIGEIADRSLERYLGSRAIPVDLARRYLSEMDYRIGADKFRALAFANNAGGYEVRTAAFKGSLGKKDIRTLGTSTGGEAALFEGVYDFLSVLAAHGRDEPAGRVIVLNSVNMVRRAIEAIRADSISSFACYFDHDLAGEMAFAELRREVELSRERSIVVRDDSALYSGYKDVNEWWIANALRNRLNDRGSQVRGVF